MILPVVGEGLVELSVLVLRDVIGITSPQWLRLVQLLVLQVFLLDGLLFLLLLVLVLIFVIVIIIRQILYLRFIVILSTMIAFQRRHEMTIYILVEQICM